ncbi:MAG: shikimate dehydrogenase [Salinivirgaceae bacterium]|nr:shikimate dehydrogenase [Salinivirgaceae bacterium]
MKTYGLVGYPLGHSFSQDYFTKKFAAENIDAQYLNFQIEDIALFPEKVLTVDGLSGLNVTIPYKQKVMAYLDEIDETAQKVGAVNVVKIIRRGSNVRLRGCNSDVVGFENSLKPLLKPCHTSAYILGTGGASKAVRYVLEKLGISYQFVSRTADAANNILSYEQLTNDLIASHKLIVNCTPLGMSPKTDACPAIPYEAIGPDHLCFDLIYNPEVTLFLQKARQQGATIKNGLDMLIGQAIRAWDIWNGDN